MYLVVSSFCGPLLRTLVAAHIVVEELWSLAMNIAGHVGSGGCWGWKPEGLRQISTCVKCVVLVVLGLKELWWAGGL